MNTGLMPNQNDEEAVHVQCDKCKKQFLLIDVQPEEKIITVVDQKFDVSYWRCPKCGQPYIVLIKDSEMSRKMIAYECEAKTAYDARQKGKALNASDFNQLRKLKIQMGEYQNKLKDRWEDDIISFLSKE